LFNITSSIEIILKPVFQNFIMKYTCRYCGYSTEKSSKPERCNYCSKPGMEEEESADEILDLA
jgi:rubrerythrin